MLQISHIELKEANIFVAKHHRHHKPVTGHRFSIGCFNGDILIGVAIVGRPIVLSKKRNKGAKNQAKQKKEYKKQKNEKKAHSKQAWRRRNGYELWL